MNTSRSFNRFTPLAALLVMSGCATTTTLPSGLDLPKRAPPSTVADTSSVVGGPAGSVTVNANPAPPTTPPKAGATEPVKPASGAADITLNFDQIPLPAFIQAVYGTALKRTISIDPAVASRKDLVTFRSGKPLTATEAESSARMVLKGYGVAVQDIPGLTRVVPDNSNAGYLPEIRRGRALPDSPLPLRPVFQMVELQAVRSIEVSSYLRTLFGEKLRFTEDAARNALLLSGNGDDVQAALDAIQVLDQPLFKGRNSVRLTPAIWSADELAKRLTEILTQEGYAVGTAAAGGLQFPITLLPVSGINSVIVFAQSPEIIKHVTEWAAVLDKPAEKTVGRSYFSYQVRNTDASRLAETVQQLLTGQLARPAPTTQATNSGSAPAAPVASGGVVVDKATNTILFKASGEDYTDIIRLLRELDRAARQVLIEVTVAQVDLTDSMTLGVDWIFRSLNNSGLNISQLGGNTGGQVTSFGGFTGFAVTQLDRLGQPRAVLNALASDNKITLLSNPSIIARNGETANIQVGSSVPILTSQQTNSSTGGSGLISTVQYRDVGTILNIKPVIHSSDQVDMEVTQEVSSVASNATGGINSATIKKNSLTTKLTLKHGSTYILGGLISNDVDRTKSGVPFLKDLPIVGQAFSKTTSINRRNELVMLITPYIMSDDGEARAVTDAFRRQLGEWAQSPRPPATNQQAPAQ
jgi:general secretion pathway protein D